MEITTVGLDLAKNVFQVHAIGSTGGVVVRRSLRRAQVIPFFSKLPPCLIGMEACGTSHHWARELVGLGHEVRLMPPAYVKPYVKRGKTDAGDAEAIGAARPHLVRRRPEAVLVVLSTEVHMKARRSVVFDWFGQKRHEDRYRQEKQQRVQGRGHASYTA